MSNFHCSETNSFLAVNLITTMWTTNLITILLNTIMIFALIKPILLLEIFNPKIKFSDEINANKLILLNLHKTYAHKHRCTAIFNWIPFVWVNFVLSLCWQTPIKFNQKIHRDKITSASGQIVSNFNQKFVSNFIFSLKIIDKTQ